jgi:TPR repeat protein
MEDLQQKAARMANEAHSLMKIASMSQIEREIIAEAAKRGNLVAQFRQGMICQAAGQFQDAAHWYSKAATAKPPYGAAAHNLASLTKYGLGVEQNIDRAVALYIVAGDHGELSGYLEAGRLLVQQGKFRSALPQLRKATKVPGNVGDLARCMAADLLSGGKKGVKANPARAAALIDEAVAHKYPPALVRKGASLLSMPVGDDDDRHEGLLLLAEAARLRDPNALPMLQQAQSRLGYEPRTRRLEGPVRYVS